MDMTHYSLTFMLILKDFLFQTTQDVNSYHVQMEHVLMLASVVMAKSIAEILLMKLIAVSPMCGVIPNKFAL